MKLITGDEYRRFDSIQRAEHPSRHARREEHAVLGGTQQGPAQTQSSHSTD